MFLFSKKHKTPVSTYTNSYRLPRSIKKTIQEQGPLQLWKENKFVTPGLTMPPVQNLVSQGQPEQLIKAAMQEYSRNTIDPAAYWLKNWLARSKEKYNPVFVTEDKYITWRTGPCNSAAWNKHSSYLPLLPKETRMETFLHSIPVTYTLKPTCLNQSERAVITGMLHQLPVYTVTGSGLFQCYYSPCSGHHYCLRGMGCYLDGAPAIRRHLHTLGERAVRLRWLRVGWGGTGWLGVDTTFLVLGTTAYPTSSVSCRSIPCCSYSPRAMFCTPTHHPQPSLRYRSPKWDTSHFKKTGGVQRGSYTIHLEFISEAYSAP
ncbi:SMRP1 protein, partial [Chunga burmeisteri]|nr:SMRP1 protein [Chunga burmeisteri]